MKKILVFNIILLVIALNDNYVSAQGIGFKGGLNLANVSSDDIDDTDLRFGFAIGGFLSIGLNEQFFFRPEIYYSSKGFKLNMEQSESSANHEISFSGETTVSLNYIEVPVLGVFAVTKNINLFAGPYLDVFLSGKTTLKSEGYYRYLWNDEWITEDIGGSSSEDIKSEEINSPGIGLLFGAEYIIGQFSFDIRYSLGLSNIPDEDDADAKHQVIQVMVGFYLP